MYKLKSSWNKDSERTKQSMDSYHCSESVEPSSEKGGSSWKRRGTGLQVQLCVCVCGGGGGGWMLLYVHINCRLITIRDRNAGRTPRLAHSSWAPCVSVCARVCDILWMSPKDGLWERPCSRKVCSTGGGGGGGGLLGYNSVPVPVSTITDQPWVTRVVILISH